MRTWKEFLKSLTRAPLGSPADGRTLGLGLATAMERSRQDATAEVEEFLRSRARDERRATTSR
ncbi:MAG: hypothetical protein GEU98_21055 [Pseudonocardiaceae bacterium]|nr:hypothetical protein [Pseudonocardiaceae bacterium]